MSRYFIRLSYKGTAYAGWQVQQNAMTVQETLNKAMAVLTGIAVETTGCGRTDAGVHATQFFAHFDGPASIDCSDMVYRLNAILPADIAVAEIIPVQPDAHARFDATGRTYEYHMHRKKDPFLKEYSNFIPYPLHIEHMQQACRHIIGNRDYSVFAKKGNETHNNFCDLTDCRILEKGHRLTLSISANRFLRNMVRAITGTLIEVGAGKIRPDEVPDLIATHDRSNAGASVPACGLYLCHIRYPYIADTGKSSIERP